MELSIDTSSNTAGIALSDNGVVLSEFNWFSEMNHNRELMPNIINILGNKRNIQDINGIIVAIGPGSFNGLRVGISVAKGLAVSLKVPLVGITTLEGKLILMRHLENQFVRYPMLVEVKLPQQFFSKIMDNGSN